MQSPVEALSTALMGRSCRVTRREFDWSFDFGERVNLAASVPWRVVTADAGIAHGSDDDGHLFGLPAPVNGEARTNDLLRGQKVHAVQLDDRTADLRISFDGGARLDFFNKSANYEGWHATFPAGGKDTEIIALGGGDLALF